jgi:hypothetical protein
MDNLADIKAATSPVDPTSNPIVQKLDALSIPHTTYPHTLSN